MKKMIIIFALCLVFTSCKKNNEGDDLAGGNMQYDSFRGSSSSIVNRVQLEAFDKCLKQFDFEKYKGKIVEVTVYAANDHVKEQITTLLNLFFVKNWILTPKQEFINGKPIQPKVDYTLEINAVCGGYHFYPGFIFYNYQSTARAVMLEKTPKGESRIFDSKYQETTIFKPVFTEEFRTSVYILVFGIICLIAFRLGAFKIARRKNPCVEKDVQ